VLLATDLITYEWDSSKNKRGRVISTTNDATTSYASGSV